MNSNSLKEFSEVFDEKDLLHETSCFRYLEEINFYKFKKNNKYGVCDLSGNIIINSEYDSISYLGNIEQRVLFKVEKDDKYGIINNIEYLESPIDKNEIYFSNQTKPQYI